MYALDAQSLVGRGDATESVSCMQHLQILIDVALSALFDGILPRLMNMGRTWGPDEAVIPLGMVGIGSQVLSVR